MKIKHVKLTHLRNDEHFEFIEFTLDLVKDVGAAALRVEAPAAALDADWKREDEALKKIMKSALTAEIDAADATRDDIFRGLTNTVRGALTHFEEARRKAAARVEIVLDTYGNAAARSHFEETSAIHNLLVELTGVKHAADVETLDLGGWISELDRRNTAVKKLLEQRTDESADRTSLVLKTVRTEVDAAYRALAGAVDALATVDALSGGASAALYGGFIRRLNERIDFVNDSLAIRRGIAAAEKARQEAEAAAAAGVDVETWRAMRAAAAAAEKAAKLVAAGAARAAVVERSDAAAVEVVGAKKL